MLRQCSGGRIAIPPNRSFAGPYLAVLVEERQAPLLKVNQSGFTQKGRQYGYSMTLG